MVKVSLAPGAILVAEGESEVVLGAGHAGGARERALRGPERHRKRNGCGGCEEGSGKGNEERASRRSHVRAAPFWRG